MASSDDTGQWTAFLRGDPAAFAGLYESYYNDLLWFGTRYCNDPELTRDEIHQLFLALWNKRHALPDVTNIRSYILTSLRNRLVTALEKAGRRVPAAESESPSWEQTRIGIEDNEQLLATVKKAIRTLAPRQQELIMLRYYQGLSAAEIADKTGLTARTVYNTLHTALANLRAALEKEQIDPRAARNVHRLLSLLLLVH